MCAATEYFTNLLVKRETWCRQRCIVDISSGLRRRQECVIDGCAGHASAPSLV